ncbi:heparan-alpha-glucosaminide N-acetyltransferase isoform X2 [Oratosquilla oratoria]|uniref:heparan-alpha-glucosaminide N-acetyltransferase isoform X2 n=1 Tax=Oratosquilla oratoria TaxID=337810 RepID=UPI003F7708B1
MWEDPGVSEFEGFDLQNLDVDEAIVRFQGSSKKYLYTLYEECYGCPYSKRGRLKPEPGEDYYSLTLTSKHAWNFRYSNKNNATLHANKKGLCDITDVQLGEFGVYEVNFYDCTVQTLKEPVYVYSPLIIAFVLYACAGLLWTIGSWLHQKGYLKMAIDKILRRSTRQMEVEMAPGTSQTPEEPVKKRVRLKSLDTFRGISIVLMIFVNYGGGGYWFMEHAAWNGLLVADLVFPWFMWIMGVCIPMGIRSQLRREVPKHKMLARIFKRSLKLFIIGIILNSLGGWLYLDKYRIPGVLQRFAIAYLVVASIASILTPAQTSQYKGVLEKVADIAILWPQWIIHLVLLAVYCLIVFLLPVPNCPTGYLGPGGLHENTGPDCIGGATGLVDRVIVGVTHIYQNPTAKHIYKSGAFDPEGVLGSMTSIFQVFLGLQAGMTIQVYTDWKDRVIRWGIWGVVLGILGAILCAGSMNDGPIPVNKNLWSLSYVCVTSCFAFILLAVCYLVVDVQGIWSGAPFYQAGMNGILMYAGHNFCYNLFPFHYILARPMNTHAILLTECLWGTTLWVLIAIYLHHKGKFYTV